MYGLTETSPIITINRQEKGFCKLGSVGALIDGVELKFAGDGEILCRGHNVMLGYYKDEELTRSVIDADGWFKTGDLGVLDEDGYLYIKGRIKNVIIGPSGENIYPEEIESVINACEDVQESLVFEQTGKLIARIYLDYEKLEKVFAHLKLTETQIKDRIPARLEEIKQGINARLSSFSRINTVIEQTEPFEKTPTKKIKRYLYVQPVE